MMRQTRRRLTVTPDLPGDALILRDPFRPLLAACAAAAAVAPDIKVLKGRVVSGDQFVSPAEQKERILATFGDLCCEMEGCTIAQAAYLNGVPLVVVRAISDKPWAEGRVLIRKKLLRLNSTNIGEMWQMQMFLNVYVC